MSEHDSGPAAGDAAGAAEAEAPQRSSLGGGLSLSFAKLWFLIAGYAVVTALTWIWRETPAVYGQYTTVAYLISWPNMVIVQTLLFAVSRPLAGEYEQGLPSYRALRRRGLLLGLGLGGPVFLSVFLGAEFIAETLLRDPELTTPLRAVSLVPMIYALYGVNVGTLNATRRFGLQALLDMAQAATKATVMCSLALSGFSLAYVVGGFTASSGTVLLLSVVLVRWRRPASASQPVDPARPVPPMAAFAGSLVLFTAVLNLLTPADLLMLKRLTPADQQDLVGFYSAALQIARVPFSLMAAVALVMFPLIATIHAARDRERTTRYVAETARLTAGMLCFMSAVGAACAPEILALIFPAKYGVAADWLRFLVWGFSGYSFVVTVAWVFNSAQKSKLALGLAGLTLVVVLAATQLLIPAYGPAGGSYSVAIAAGVGVLAALVALHLVFDARIPLGFLLKMLGACAATELAARAPGWEHLPGGRLGILLQLCGISLVFLAVVAATRAVTLDQLRALRKPG